MHVGVMKIYIEVTDSLTLKDKRMVLRSLKDRIKKSFNVSVAETDDHDKWQTSTLGVAAVSNDTFIINSMFNKVVDLLEDEKRILVLDVVQEMLQ